MATLLQRIRKLESRLTDTTGFAPYSEAWFEYLENIFERLMAGENPIYPGNFPLAVADRMIERVDREAGIIP
jgi:hypothetical protein